MKSCDILVIEDDPSIQSLVLQTLEPLGLKINCESDGAVGETRSREYLPAVILLDLGLPSMPGMEILKRLKPWFKGSIIVITAMGDDEKKFEAFNLGADDYVSKPFSPRDLLARVRVALRHTKGDSEDSERRTIRVANLTIDRKEHRVVVREEAFAVTQTEFQFLVLLGQNQGQLVSQKVLLEKIWGPNHAEDTHYLRILVSRLRKKLKQANAEVSLVTETGLGYRLL